VVSASLRPCVAETRSRIRPDLNADSFCGARMCVRCRWSFPARFSFST
jgi:hypothetical protein